MKGCVNRCQLNRHSCRYGRRATAVALVLVLTACASGPNANPRDPLEPFNRGVFQFNEVVDTAVIRPVAKTYVDVVPELARRGVGNFFGNLQDAWSFVNNTLQFKGEAAANSLLRFGVNTVIGIGGVFDVASEMNIERNTKDFGHTLGYWGVAPGPYLVLPFFGPSSVRDSLGSVLDSQGDISARVSDVPTRNTLTAVHLIGKRAGLLPATEALGQAALDKYTFTRDAYLQRRRNAVFDGNPPDEESQDNSATQR